MYKQFQGSYLPATCSALAQLRLYTATACMLVSSPDHVFRFCSVTAEKASTKTEKSGLGLHARYIHIDSYASRLNRAIKSDSKIKRSTH